MADERLVERLALLTAGIVDLPNARAPQARLVGFVIIPDEHYQPGDGVEMLNALQRLAGADIVAIKTAINHSIEGATNG
jgi:hypothetical protein